MERVISGCGILVMMLLAYLLCPRSRRRNVNFRTVGGGMLVLICLSVIVLQTPARALFAWANDIVGALLAFSRQGAEFVFGGLVSNSKSFGSIFAFQILPTIIFFAAFMSVLYYVGIMPFIIRQMGRLLARVLCISGAESFSTVSDIFVGMTEAPLVIRPYLPRLTLSELNACMTAGLATTAGGVLAAYVTMLQDLVPDIAGHLITCSVLCAPAALVIAKLALPETETPETLGDTRIAIPRTSTNPLDAVTAGTIDGLRLAVNVGAMLISFIALTALVNAGLNWIGNHIFDTPLSLERIFGWIFAPIAWVMGVPIEDVGKVATLLGQKTALNEFVAYTNMSQMLAKNPEWLTERGRLVASYALCGFANFGSIGITIGGYAALAPTRRADVAGLGFRAMAGGFLTTCMVACVVGVLL